MEPQLFDFSDALRYAKEGKKISRISFRDTCYIVAKRPAVDKSENTLSYLQMVKGEDIFPVDLSCESIFAMDRYLLD